MVKREARGVKVTCSGTRGLLQDLNQHLSDPSSTACLLHTCLAALWLMTVPNGAGSELLLAWSLALPTSLRHVYLSFSQSYSLQITPSRVFKPLVLKPEYVFDVSTPVPRPLQPPPCSRQQGKAASVLCPLSELSFHPGLSWDVSPL